MSASNHQSSQTPDAEPKPGIGRRHLRIVVLGVATTVLFGLLFVQAAFDVLPWLRPVSVSGTLSLYVLSTFNFLAFIVLLMVLVRNVIKLQRERKQRKLGARFKTRLVVFSIALSLLPVTFLFFATTGLINRSIEKWFGLRGLDMMNDARDMQAFYLEAEAEGIGRIAATFSRLMGTVEDEQPASVLAAEVDNHKLMLAQLYNRDGDLIAQKLVVNPNTLTEKARKTLGDALASAMQGIPFSKTLIDGEDQPIQLIAAAPIGTDRGGAIVIAQQVPQEFAKRVKNFEQYQAGYEELRIMRNRVRNAAMQTLYLITLLVLFIAFWLALYLARTIADPVQQMAEATERIKKGDLSYRAEVVGDDELAALVLSFNEMTAELGENRRRLEQSAEDLQQSNAALDERRRYIEAILQSLSAGVISIDEHLKIRTINNAAMKLLRIEQPPSIGAPLETLLPADQLEELRRMLARATRLRSATREIHFTLANGTKLDASMMVTTLLDPRGQSSGAVVVIEDLTELIEAQRRAAWSEVARRMAHEIKNPLTPIRLSAERLAKNLLKKTNGSGALNALNPRQTELVQECTTMIGAEVATLQRMVDEFSSFARLPNAKLETFSLNAVVEKTLKLYDERLKGIRLEGDLDPAIPPILIDPEQIKRVLVNLIDNAVEALADVSGVNGEPGPQQTGEVCRITVSTREMAERDLIELVVADNGPGIRPEDRERIFDPYFSTRKRGTGLGLAIVSHIVIEHQGRIRMQENVPRGSRFIVELPNTKTVDG